MAPTPRPTLHLSTLSILFFYLSFLALTPHTLAATLPKPNRHIHKVLGTRDDSTTSAPFTAPKNGPLEKGKGFWGDLGDLADKYNIFDFWSDLFSGKKDGKKVGGNEGKKKSTTTIFVVPTPVEKSVMSSGSLTSTTTTTSKTANQGYGVVTPSVPIYYSTIPISVSEPPPTSSPTSSSTVPSEEEDTFSILPWILPGENISDNVTYPTPTGYAPEEPVVITISDDFPNEPTPTAQTPTTTVIPGEEETDTPIFSILPWIPVGQNITDNVTTTPDEEEGGGGYEDSIGILSPTNIYEIESDYTEEPPSLSSPSSGGYGASGGYLSWNSTTLNNSASGSSKTTGLLIYTNPLRPTDVHWPSTSASSTPTLAGYSSYEEEDPEGEEEEGYEKVSTIQTTTTQSRTQFVFVTVYPSPIAAQSQNGSSSTTVVSATTSTPPSPPPPPTKSSPSNQGPSSYYSPPLIPIPFPYNTPSNNTSSSSTLSTLQNICNTTSSSLSPTSQRKTHHPLLISLPLLKPFTPPPSFPSSSNTPAKDDDDDDDDEKRTYFFPGCTPLPTTNTPTSSSSSSSSSLPPPPSQNCTLLLRTLSTCRRRTKPNNNKNNNQTEEQQPNRRTTTRRRRRRRNARKIPPHSPRPIHPLPNLAPLLPLGIFLLPDCDKSGSRS
ncbi:hypothetical protein DM02DRAFT_657384 [Periconia macrospinosa]|uniref:Uncharacterized protein n=1 Tax=Periconia macrospinosa TaxID=97972 RepID=A0A2V1DJI7_9PLEO|nr:hypothetical protein DM02DRAFT_657384 [Periconia macrospinosa]